MKYFSNSYMEFFKELENNNNKEWFHQNKDRFENEVNNPFKNFIQELLEKIYTEDQTIQIKADEAIFRINRDIRFSKDKTPYKLFRSALISPFGKKLKTEPGFYIELGINYFKIKGGCFKLSKDGYKLLDKHFDQIISFSQKGSFASKFSSVSLQPDSITYEANNSSDIIFSEDILEIVFDYWKSSNPIVNIIKRIIGESV